MNTISVPGSILRMIIIPRQPWTREQLIKDFLDTWVDTDLIVGSDFAIREGEPTLDIELAIVTDASTSQAL